MPPTHDAAVGRRQFVQYGLAGSVLGTGGFTRSVRAAIQPLDDIGNPYEPVPVSISSGTGSMGPRSLANSLVNEGSRPDGTIKSKTFEWIQPGAPSTGNRFALRLSDDGGVDPGFRLTTPADLTIDCHVRHHSGQSVAYLFNDADSLRYGFRAFTNGRAGRGLFIRNVFGGSDLSISKSIQDGDWHQVRVVLDATEGEFSTYIDGELAGRSSYHGEGWTALDSFRLMGRRNGSATQLEFDRFLISDEAIHPPTGTSFDGNLVHYELEEGSGRTVGHGRVETGPTVEDKRALIEEIRTEAATILSADRADELEEPADSLLDVLETSESTDDLLDRLIAAERVTKTATTAGIEVARRLGRLATELAMSLGGGRIAARTLRLGGWAARRLRAIYREITARCQRGLDLVIGRPILGRKFERELTSIVSGIDLAMGATLEAHGEELETVGEELVEKEIEEAIETLPDDVSEAIASIGSEFADRFALAIYDRYQFGDSGGQWAMESPKAPGLGRSIDGLVTSIHDVIDVSGMAAVDFRHAVDPDAIEATATAGIDEDSERFADRMAAVDAVAGTAGMMAVVSATIAMGAFVSGIVLSATGVGLVAGGMIAAIGAKLAVYASLFGAVAGILTTVGFATGIDFLRRTEVTHHDSAVRLLSLDEPSEVVA